MPVVIIQVMQQMRKFEYKIHNLHDDELANEESFSDVFQIFLDWISSTIIAAGRATGTRYLPGMINKIVDMQQYTLPN